jgi:2-deoxy-D-gluconate 3-dehydrogenase
MSVLLDASFELSQQAGQIMVKQGNGKIIQIASTAAFKEGAGLIAYATAKSALITMTRYLASALAGFNINVNAIAPGIFNTDINEALFKNSEALARRCKQVPSGRLGEPDDIVGPMLFLASEQSRHIHGQTIIVDGGFTLN